jgi:hypothetical protein
LRRPSRSRTSSLLLALLIVAGGCEQTQDPAVSPTPEGGLGAPLRPMLVFQGFRACGHLSEHRPPTTTLPGSITVDGEHYSIPSSVIQDIWEGARVGTNVCLAGTYVQLEAGRELRGKMTLGGYAPP